MGFLRFLRLRRLRFLVLAGFWAMGFRSSPKSWAKLTGGAEVALGWSPFWAIWATRIFSCRNPITPPICQVPAPSCVWRTSPVRPGPADTAAHKLNPARPARPGPAGNSISRLSSSSTGQNKQSTTTDSSGTLLALALQPVNLAEQFAGPGPAELNPFCRNGAQEWETGCRAPLVSWASSSQGPAAPPLRSRKSSSRMRLGGHRPSLSRWVSTAVQGVRGQAEVYAGGMPHRPQDAHRVS